MTGMRCGAWLRLSRPAARLAVLERRVAWRVANRGEDESERGRGSAGKRGSSAARAAQTRACESCGSPDRTGARAGGSGCPGHARAGLRRGLQPLRARRGKTELCSSALRLHFSFLFTSVSRLRPPCFSARALACSLAPANPSSRQSSASPRRSRKDSLVAFLTQTPCLVLDPCVLRHPSRETCRTALTEFEPAAPLDATLSASSSPFPTHVATTFATPTAFCRPPRSGLYAVCRHVCPRCSQDRRRGRQARPRQGPVVVRRSCRCLDHPLGWRRPRCAHRRRQGARGPRQD